MLGLVLYVLKDIAEVPVLLLLTGYFYSHGLKISGKCLRLKAGYGIKNAVIGFSWASSIMLSIKESNLAIFAFFFLKLFLNSTLFDLKDQKKDTARTLPKLFGKKFRTFLTFLNVKTHLIAFWCFGFHIIVITSFLLTQTALMLEEHVARKVIDAESSLSLLSYRFSKNWLLHD
jgi:4-hydroxybenzoate polyprenyltransferase